MVSGLRIRGKGGLRVDRLGVGVRSVEGNNKEDADDISFFHMAG